MAALHPCITRYWAAVACEDQIANVSCSAALGYIHTLLDTLLWLLPHGALALPHGSHFYLGFCMASLCICLPSPLRTSPGLLQCFLSRRSYPKNEQESGDFCTSVSISGGISPLTYHPFLPTTSRLFVMF